MTSLRKYYVSIFINTKSDQPLPIWFNFTRWDAVLRHAQDIVWPFTLLYTAQCHDKKSEYCPIFFPCIGSGQQYVRRRRNGIFSVVLSMLEAPEPISSYYLFCEMNLKSDIYICYWHVSDIQAVQDNDGLEVVTRDKKWIHIAARLGYQPGKGIANTLRQHYEKLIYPYDVFLLSATPDVKVIIPLSTWHKFQIIVHLTFSQIFFDSNVTPKPIFYHVLIILFRSDLSLFNLFNCFQVVLEGSCE